MSRNMVILNLPNIVQGFVFPYHFGFIPGLMGADGNSLDILVLMDEAMSRANLLRAGCRELLKQSKQSGTEKQYIMTGSLRLPYYLKAWQK